jgi:hypothetical protein
LNLQQKNFNFFATYSNVTQAKMVTPHLVSIHQNVGPNENYIIPKVSPLQPQPIGITNHN